MKYYLDFDADVRRGDIAPVYLFYGDERYLQRRAAEALFTALLEPSTASFNYDAFDGETTALSTIVAAAESLPVLHQRRLVVVKNPPIGSDHAGRRAEDASGVEAMAGYLEHPSPTTCLVLVVPGGLDRKKRLTKALLQSARVIEFTPLAPPDIRKWLAKQAREAGKSFTDGAVRTLVAAVGKGGLTALEQECAKLLAYASEREVISEDDVRELVPVSAEETIFSVIDAVADNKPIRAVEGIKKLLVAREPPSKILGLLANQFRLILLVDELVGDGVAEGAMASRLRVPRFVVQRTLRQRQRIGAEGARRALAEILNVDVDLKTSQRDFLPSVTDLIIGLKGIHR